MFPETQNEIIQPEPESNDEMSANEPDVKSYEDVGDKLFPKEKGSTEVSGKDLKYLKRKLEKNQVNMKGREEKMDVASLLSGDNYTVYEKTVMSDPVLTVKEFTLVDKNGTPKFSFSAETGEDVGWDLNMYDFQSIN